MIFFFSKFIHKLDNKFTKFINKVMYIIALIYSSPDNYLKCFVISIVF